MAGLAHTAVLILAQAEPAGKEEGGNFLVKPGIGLMIWLLLAFGITLLILRKYAFPAISNALDRRQRAIEESIETARRTKEEAEELLNEYRERLKAARAQSEEIITRARKAAEQLERESHETAKVKREELLEQTRRDIEAETRRAIEEIRSEVAGLTIMATEKVTRKALTEEDQQRLVEEALAELDFASLAGDGRS